MLSHENTNLSKILIETLWQRNFSPSNITDFFVDNHWTTSWSYFCFLGWRFSGVQNWQNWVSLSMLWVSTKILFICSICHCCDFNIIQPFMHLPNTMAIFTPNWRFKKSEWYDEKLQKGIQENLFTKSIWPRTTWWLIQSLLQQ